MAIAKPLESISKPRSQSPPSIKDRPRTHQRHKVTTEPTEDTGKITHKGTKARKNFRFGGSSLFGVGCSSSPSPP